MRALPVFILFLLQIILFFIIAFIIFIINMAFDKNFGLGGTLLLLSGYPAVLFSFSRLMSRLGITDTDAIVLTKIMVWLQIIPVFIIIITGFVEEKLTITETIILIVAGITTVAFLRFAGIKTIRRIALKT